MLKLQKCEEKSKKYENCDGRLDGRLVGEDVRTLALFVILSPSSTQTLDDILVSSKKKTKKNVKKRVNKVKIVMAFYHPDTR